MGHTESFHRNPILQAFRTMLIFNNKYLIQSVIVSFRYNYEDIDVNGDLVQHPALQMSITGRMFTLMKTEENKKLNVIRVC
jgi:hypothetical protein